MICRKSSQCNISSSATGVFSFPYLLLLNFLVIILLYQLVIIFLIQKKYVVISKHLQALFSMLYNFSYKYIWFDNMFVSQWCAVNLINVTLAFVTGLFPLIEPPHPTGNEFFSPIPKKCVRQIAILNRYITL